MSNFDIKSYFEQIAQEAGLSDDEKAGVLKGLSNEKVAKKFNEGFLRQEDYSRSKDQLAAEKKQLQEQANKLTSWYEDTAVPALNSTNERIKAYEDAYGPIEAGIKSQIDPNQFVSKQAFEEALQSALKQRDTSYVNLTKSLLKISNEHARQFPGEDLDLDSLERFAIEKNLPPEIAYKEFVSPKVEEKRNREIEDRIKQAKEEGAKEYATRVKMPVDARPPERGAFFQRMEMGDKEPAPNAGRNAFIEEFQKEYTA